MKSKKRIAIIGTVGIPARYGGFETLAEQLVTRLSHEFSFTVFCSKKAYPKSERVKDNGQVKKIYLPLAANGLQSIVYDVVSVIWGLFISDVLLVLGVSGAFILPVIKLFSRKKIILHIDGLEWKRAKWNGLAKKFLKASEAVGVRFADVIIADNEEIRNHIKSSYQCEGVLIEYGGDHVITGNTNKQLTTAENGYAFSVCRIEPENNIEMILQAFSTMPSRQLVLVGNWFNSQYSKALYEKYTQYPNLRLTPPIYDIKALNELRQNCYMYVHGHSAGGTNPSLVEAMCLELPVLAYSVNYNIYSTQSKALYFSSASELVSVYQSVSDEKRAEVALDMKRVADERYKWSIIIAKYRDVFCI
ncbi:DUF1972 domain-containing protein [Chitinophaga filiformis]|uniref:Glycosyltransferase involved in cell wall bisynthesis n=1 Tax=Chitinophaga filiformis TaxID=104663 RepID=A0A1G7UCR0_CHIFI|nr:DUF1972 domain-containing protein [Chitinophaga filiformis]SDG45138.1 Glycosyltransferase involved in cell wall bisynthesis [Chitinophaga filiformis]